MYVLVLGEYICNQSRRAAAEVSDEGDLECAKVTVSSRHDRGPYAFSDIPAALHSGVQVGPENTLSDLPFVDAFNGVVSRRALLKVSTIF